MSGLSHLIKEVIININEFITVSYKQKQEYDYTAQLSGYTKSLGRVNHGWSCRFAPAPSGETVPSLGCLAQNAHPSLTRTDISNSLLGTDQLGSPFSFARYFINQNKILYRKDGSKRLPDTTLVALTVLIAQSKPEEKDTITKVIVNLINKKIV